MKAALFLLLLAAPAFADDDFTLYEAKSKIPPATSIPAAAGS